MSNLDFSDSLRNARANLIESHVGASPILKLRTGAKPTNVAAGSTGTVVATMTLPADWRSAASGGVTGLLGTWQDLAADASGLIGHFELLRADGVTVEARGTVTATGGGGVMTVDNPDVVAGQQIAVTSFDVTEGNA